MVNEKEWLKTDLQYDIWNKKYRYNNETLEQFFDRVSNGNESIKKLIIDKKFLPAGRILANRGLHKDGRKVTYSNCYVISQPEDNLESIFECASKLARTYSFGGGCGIDISKLSPRGARINNAAKETTGSVSFMDLYSLITSLIGQSGRRGALMISLDCNHPDLLEFIDIKNDLNKVTKANISIKITDEFMQAVKDNKEFELQYIRKETGEVISKTINAREVFYKIAENNWRMAEPGFLMWDRIKNWNLLSEDKNFEYVGVNPCAEEPLPAGGSCLLGSFNLSSYVKNPFKDNAYFDYEEFENDIATVVTFMNEILDEGLLLHPLKEQQDSVNNWRQIGIGYMALGDMFIKMGIKYGDKKSLELSDTIGFSLINNAIKQSALLAKQYGTYPKYSKAVMKSKFFIENTDDETKELVKKYGLRNSQLLTCAPTGSLSNMLGVSGGLEPIYQISYIRKTESLHGEDKYYKVFTPIVKEFMELNNIKEEKDLPDYFVTAMNINYKDRIAMQSIWQKHIDASISSTINVPENFTVEEVADLYIKAWEMGLKGVTIYRDNCDRNGILSNNEQNKKHNNTNRLEWGVTIASTDDLIGKKRKIMSGCGSLHVQAWYDPADGRLTEVYFSKGSDGGCNSWMISNSRTISAGLRTGISFDYIIDQLKSSPACPSYVVRTATKRDTSKGNCCPVAVANALLEMQKEVNYELGIDEETFEQKSKKNLCPECGEPLKFEGGCNSCSNCSYSKCE